MSRVTSGVTSGVTIRVIFGVISKVTFRVKSGVRSGVKSGKCGVNYKKAELCLEMKVVAWVVTVRTFVKLLVTRRF